MTARLAAALLLMVSGISTGTAQAATTVLSFDALPDRAVVGDAFRDLGVVFENAEVVTISNQPGGSSPRRVRAFGTFQWLADQAVVVRFLTPVDAVGVTALDVGVNGFVLEALGAGGTVLGMDQAEGEGVGAGRVDELSVIAPGIVGARFFQRVNVLGDGIVVDDFSLTRPDPPPTTGVPEPATWVSLLLGFALTALRLRRGTGSAPLAQPL